MCYLHGSARRGRHKFPVRWAKPVVVAASGVTPGEVASITAQTGMGFSTAHCRSVLRRAARSKLWLANFKRSHVDLKHTHRAGPRSDSAGNCVKLACNPGIVYLLADMRGD